MSNGRGKITAEINETALRVLGTSISQDELRLMPYVQYVMMNEQRIEPKRIDVTERKILQTWRDRGWIEGGAYGLSMTKEFWNAINEILWLGYVNYAEKENG